MLQELADLDFDTYFDVASSNQQPPQQQQNPRSILYHGDQQQQPTSINALLNSNNANTNRQLYHHQYNQQQQQTFGIFDWDLTPQSQNITSPTQVSPISSPHSSSDGYTSTSLSPQMMTSPPLYSFNPHIKDEASKAFANCFPKKPMFPSHLHNVPGINIPTTPTTENGPSFSDSSNLPSPSLEGNTLSAAFLRMDQWSQLKDHSGIHPLDTDLLHETRHWRKTSTRHQQLQQSLGHNRSFPEPGKQLKKVAHNAIERRYRNNINDRIRELKNVVPALYKAHIREKGDEEDSSAESCGEEASTDIVEGVEVAKKLNKATILRKATEYIQFLKNTHDATEQENMILQQIIAQMPGGNDVLACFLSQKSEFEKSEQARLTLERREAQEHERIERQRILRERAAQRAALAQLLPKPERRPYRRRQSSKNTKAVSKKASPQEDGTGNKMFMAAFMCVAFFSSPQFTSGASPSSHHYNAQDDNQSTATANSRPLHSAAVSTDYWKFIRYMFYSFGIIYICVIPLLFRWLRPRPVNRSKKCLDHHHYANEVSTAWSRLYTNLTSIVNKSSLAKHDSDIAKPLDLLASTYCIIRYSLSLLVPRFLLTMFHKHAKPVGCLEELAYVGAWIRLNEVECLGANSDITRLGMLHSCVGMFAHLHKMKRDEKHVIYCEANTMARVYATTAMQFELCLPRYISCYIAPFFWKRVITAIKNQRQILGPDQVQTQQQHQGITNQWLSSTCHQQVLQMLEVRNGFTSGNNCRNTFYSFVLLPYVTSPLDLVLYWQQLGNLQDCWFSYLNGTRPVFSEKQLTQVLSVSATTTAPGHMLQWWVLVGLALESLSHNNQQENLDALAEYIRVKIPAVDHPSSSILRRHQTMMYHMLEAVTALQTNVNADQVPHYLQKAFKDSQTSRECIEQISSTSSYSHHQNFEASVLVLSTLSVHLRTLKALVIYQQTTSSKTLHIRDKNKTLLESEASIYIAELRYQIMRDMESPYAKSLSATCTKHIQSYIVQADDTLSR